GGRGAGGSAGSGGGLAGRAGGGGGSATGGATGSAGSGGTLPCDIYAAANTACVAAHSTVRALLGSYSGPLYKVKRASDGMTKDIPVLSPGGLADTATQDAFCMGTTCTITIVYDQSGHGNFVEAETPDSTVGGHSGMTASNATQESFTVSGHKVYSLYMKTSQAYWRDGSKSGMPLGNAPQGIYMVTSGKHYGSGCCFDYGNGETSRMYVAGPSMDALNFSNCTIWGTGAGTGPWVMADLEGGLFAKGGGGQSTADPSLTYTYVTAMEKNNGTGTFALKGGDATTGMLSTFYSGNVPPGYNPSKKQGSIVLGSGGDCCYSNNTLSQGTFYEGAIVAGYPSDATDQAIQANIVSAGYGK
ncbi:MAG TPA: arabinofuranosidase catalytic domain-containing protein, partial [Polyangia bacterium]|nr:arabinofuranosidase catalytic domain-containing protein [Polyangia bacterium]